MLEGDDVNMLISETNDYISKILGEIPIVERWTKSNNLQNYLVRAYDFFTVYLFGVEFLMVISKGDDLYKAQDIEKHIQKISEEGESNKNMVFVFTSMTKYQRITLIKRKISFIVPGKQLFIPFLGMALSERFSRRQIVKSRFTPSAQALLINMLTPGKLNLSPSEISNEIGLSNMSISRAYSELKDLGLLKKYQEVSYRLWPFEENGRDTWEDAKEYLFNPVQSMVYVKKNEIDNFRHYTFIVAGESALAGMTMLMHPRIDTLAISSREWKKIKAGLIILPYEEFDTYCVQIWKHQVPRYKSKIHPLALYLTLMEEYDERVQMSLEEIIDDYPWEELIND